jgi:hypothetical protein
LDLKIDLLSLELTGAPGLEYRARPIAERAAAILAQRVDERWGRRQLNAPAVRDVPAVPIQVDLNKLSEEEAAQRIARAWLEALALKLEV